MSGDLPERRIRVAFFMLSALGNRTWAKSLQQGFAAHDGIEQLWIETDMWKDGGVPERLPVPYLLRNTTRALIEVRANVRRFKPDVLVFNPPATAGLCQWQLLRVPSILCLDATPVGLDSMSAEYGGSSATGVSAAFRHMANRVNFRLAKALVPWSQFQAESLRKDYGVPEAKIRQVPPGVDVAHWAPGHASARAAGPVRLLFVGGDFQRKGGHVLMRAFERLRADHDLELDIVSKSFGGELPPGVRVHRDLGVGSEGLRQLYQCADIFVLPTLADFSPLVIPEAMASGLPVVSTTVGGIPEMVDEGVTGLLAGAGDADALWARLDRLVRDAELRRRFGTAGRMRAVEQFSNQHMAEQIANLVAEVAGLSPRQAAKARQSLAAKA